MQITRERIRFQFNKAYKHVTGIDVLHCEESYVMDVDLDSLQRVELLMELETRARVHIDTLDDCHTIKDVLDTIVHDPHPSR